MDGVGTSCSSSGSREQSANWGGNAVDDGRDLIEEALSSSSPAKSSSNGVRTSALEDPSLEPPPCCKGDWPEVLSKLAAMVEESDASAEAEEEYVRLLYEALSQRIEDTKTQEEFKAKVISRLDDCVKERDRIRQDAARIVALKGKLEASCRELQQQKSNIAKENEKIKEDEEIRHAELKDKFETAIKDVQEKMDAELEVRQHFLKENDDLRGKLQKFTETYEAQELQLAEQNASRNAEMEVAQQRLREHEVMCSESRAKTARLEKDNEALRKSQVVLRDELQAILGKFDTFHQAVTGSNQRHGECKQDIESLQNEIAELQEENDALREAKQLNELLEEHKVIQKQRDALEKLCDNLEKENRKHIEMAKKLSSKR